MEAPASELADKALYASTLQSIGEASSGVTSLLEATPTPDYSNGISLLSLKNALLLEYMHNLVLLTLARLDGQSIAPPAAAGSAAPDGANCHKLVETLVKNRVFLEKIKPLEVKLKYQIDKLVNKSQDHERRMQERREKMGKTRATAAADVEEMDDDEIANDPLAFKPNPGALLSNGQDGSESEGSDGEANARKKPSNSTDGIYRPPRLAPVPYTEPARGKKARAPPPGNALVRDMATQLAGSTYNPYVESTSGLGATPTLQSRKAKKLADIERYEEENFTRLFMTKKDAKRRRMDEEDIALGGSGSREDFMTGAKGIRSRKSGFENEFDDVLGSIGKKRKTGQADGYEALRAMRREKRAPASSANDAELFNTNGVPTDNPRFKQKQRGQFDKAVKRNSQKQNRRDRK